MQQDTGLLLKTIDFAAKKHSTQKRKDPEGTPYINHPIGVAMILWEAGVSDICALQAAVLHDTIEDTDTTYEEASIFFTKKNKCIISKKKIDCTNVWEASCRYRAGMYR